MGKMFYRALKILFWLVLLAILATGLLLLARAMGWPRWTAGALLLGPIGCIMAVLFVRRLLFRRREKRFVRRIVEQEPDQMRLAQEAASQHAINDLRASFARAREILRRSRLTRVADPLYSLPWFLVAGPSGTGKSSALRSARLDSLVTDLVPTHGEKTGAQCEWWFQKDSVLLDTSGRFLDQDGDAPAWGEFLALLARHRRRDPVSGLVLTVSAPSLLGDEEALVTAARTVRQRVDELMRVLGARFPVYVLVTRLDAVPGFDGFADRLTEADRLQAMGAINAVPPPDPAARAREIVARVAESLKTLRLVLAHRPSLPQPGLTRFPEAFGGLEAGLARYCRELFQENPFLETPLFRGLHFAAARHAGAAGAGGADALDRFAPGETGEARLPATFLHDFFAAILPEDRGLHSPLPAFLSWRNLSRFAAVTAVTALAFCAMGLFVHAYLRNATALLSFAGEFSQTPRLTSNIDADLNQMSRLRDVVRDMERQNAAWGLPRLGYDQSLLAETTLKTLFCDLFQRGIQDPLGWLLQGEAMTLNAKTPPDQIQRYTSFLLNSIRLLDSSKHGTVDPQITALVHTDLARLSFNGARISPIFAEHYEPLHRSYLAWNTEPERNARERQALVGLLDRVIKIDKLELGWLVGWANELPGLTPFTMDQFWDAVSLEQTGLPQIPPAYTLRGREQILSLSDEIRRILDTSKDATTWAPDFKDWYAREYVATWERFAQGFNTALDWQRNEDQWHQITRRMAEPDNPYLMLLTVMGEQLAPYADRRDNPTWVAPVMRFNTMRLQALSPKKDALKEKVSSEATDITSYFKALTSLTVGRPTPQLDKRPPTPGDDVVPPTPAGPVQAKLAQLAPGNWNANTLATNGLGAFKSYLEALQALRDACQSPVAAVSLVAPKYLPTPGQPLSPFDTADRAMRDLSTALGGQDAPLFEALFLDPIRFFWGLAVVDAAEGLQNLWEEDVMVKVGHMPKDKLPQALFDETNGLVWKFVNGPAKPFLGKTPSGYHAKTSNGTAFPFTKAFLDCINKGSIHNQKVMPSYDVTATALPTDVNQGAQQRPYATELTLDCQEKVQQLVNYNYPVTQVFNWNPNSCGKTKLTIRFKAFTLAKTYPGPTGFQSFLKEFQYNSKKFAPEDFPESLSDLTQYGITAITVQYRISGGVPVIHLPKEENVQVPETITLSWGH